MSTMLKRIPYFVVIPAFTVVAVLVSLAQPGHHLDAEKIGAAAGAKPTVAKDGVVRIAWSRTDVPVTIDGLAVLGKRYKVVVSNGKVEVTPVPVR